MGFTWLILIPLIFLFLKHFRFGSIRLPPGPNRFQVLCDIYQLLYKPHIALNKLANLHGPLLSFWLGNQLVVVASSPNIAKEFCKTNDRVFSGRHQPTIYHNLPGAINSTMLLSRECNKSWKHLRSMAQSSIFSSKPMQSNAWITKAKVMEIVKYLRCKEGEIVHLQHIIFAAIANIISSVATSRNLFEFEGGVEDDSKVIMDFVNEVVEKAISLGLVDFLPILKGVDFWSKRKAMDISRRIKLIWGKIIDERRLSGRDSHNSTQDFLEIVLGEGAFSDDQIANALMELLVGATDSTTTTTIWLMVELIKNKDILDKVREEIAQTFDKDGLNETLLSQCQYFEACIKETLRLHFPAPLLVPHRAIETCKVNNYTIPKDSMVLVNAWAMAHDPDYWKDAKIFKPERFLGSKISHRGIHFEYLPFGTGLRMCPGTNMAFKNIEMLVGCLVHYFDWSLPNPNGEDFSRIDMGEKYATTLKKEKPLLLVPKFRV